MLIVSPLGTSPITVAAPEVGRCTMKTPSASACSSEPQLVALTPSDSGVPRHSPLRPGITHTVVPPVSRTRAWAGSSPNSETIVPDSVRALAYSAGRASEEAAVLAERRTAKWSSNEAAIGRARRLAGVCFAECTPLVVAACEIAIAPNAAAVMASTKMLIRLNIIHPHFCGHHVL